MIVSQTMAFTLNLGNYQSAKVEVGIHDIDTEKDIKAQVEEAKAAFDEVFIEVYKKVDQEIQYIQREAQS
tara:strand:+ start:2919 stop:3128 length:210 start_codon:yes stop_codon:yes gene_type:complete